MLWDDDNMHLVRQLLHTLCELVSGAGHPAGDTFRRWRRHCDTPVSRASTATLELIK